MGGSQRYHGQAISLYLCDLAETYLGGLEEAKSGRGTEKKALIAVAVEEVGQRFGRISLLMVSDASGASLKGFITSCAAAGCVIHTDGWSGYSGLSELSYKHEVTIVKSTKAHTLLPRTVTLLKRWLLRTHQGAIGHKHLDYYLDEFTFRFNRRTSSSRGKLFYRLVQQALMVEPRNYRMIVTKQDPARSKWPKHKMLWTPE